MVLILGESTKITGSLTLSDLYSSYPNLLEEAKRFARVPPKLVQPNGVLYVRQKEDVVTFAGDKLSDGGKITLVGTQDVLTCHVVILYHKASGVTALAHYDEYVREVRLHNLVKKFCQEVIDRTYWYHEDGYDGSEEWEWEEIDDDDEMPTDEELEELFSQVELRLIGGYNEVSRKGAALSRKILTFFANHKASFNLSLCCLGPANTKGAGRTEPIVGGVVFNVIQGRAFPAVFNRGVVDSLDEQLVMTLMLGPSLIKKPFKLKQMILAKEDEGFSKSIKTKNSWNYQ